MTRYIAKRLGVGVISLFILVTVTFFLLHAIPGGPFSPEDNRNVPPKILEKISEQYGLNDPVPEQYARYLSNLLHGDFGTSFKKQDTTVNELISQGFPVSARVPNLEIADEFLNAADDPGWEGLVQALERSENLLKSTWNLAGDAVAEGLAAIHSETASILKYNDENSLTCTILMAYYSAKAYYMNPLLELPSGKGFADVVYLPRRSVDKPALVVELKWNRSAEGAIAQIRERKYASWIENYTGEILLVGISYDEKKGHTCRIEKHLKSR